VVVSETLRHCSYSTLHVNLSHSFRSYAHAPLLHNRRTRNTTDGKTKGAIRRRLDEHPLPIPAVLASF
jgi:hypothetical protein